MIWVGVAAMFWAIWRCCNNVVFNQMRSNSMMQRDEIAKDALSTMTNKLEIIALEISNKEWKHLYYLN